MSNPLAIAAVTATLRNLLMQGITPDPDLADTIVTLHPPDQARSTGTSSNQLNLFLYLAAPNAAWRNMGVPGRVTDGETGFPPLALNLFYLLTAYGRDNDAQAPFSHRLLGRAMSIIHDHPLLGSEEIGAALPGNDLGAQIERVRLTMQPLSLEELSKLWTAFQSEYRLCAAYEAAVVLIESSRPARTPLPVLKRGPEDTGATSQADLVPPFPQILSLEPAGPVELGETVTIRGHHLDGDQVQVRLSCPRLQPPRVIAAEPGGTEALATVALAKDPTLPAGFYSLAVLVTSGSTTRVTNELPLLIAPTIVAGLPANLVPKQGAATLKLTMHSTLAPDQTVMLLLGDRAIPAVPQTSPSQEVTFAIANVEPGDFLCRVRIDGVDTNLLADRNVRPLDFDRTKKVTIQQP